MTIRVYCDCGRKLAVSDDQAGRKTLCPVCGGTVAVPKRGPRKAPRESTMKTRFIEGNGAGGTGKPDAIESAVTYGSHKPGTPRPAAPRRPRRTSWWECLFVPFDNWKFLLGFSFVGAIGAAAFSGILQGELGRRDSAAASRLLGAFLVTALPAIGLIGAFFSHVVSDPARIGKKAVRHWVLLSLEDAVSAFFRCLCCFFCGPVAAVLAAAWYWTARGGAELLDRIILCELFGLGGGWLALQILLTSGRPWTGMLPVPVVRTAWQLGSRALLVATGFGLLLGGMTPLWLDAMIATSRGAHWTAFTRWLVLFPLGLSVGGMLLRLLGGWYARIGEPLPDPELRPPPQPPFPIPTPQPLPETSAFQVARLGSPGEN